MALDVGVDLETFAIAPRIGFVTKQFGLAMNPEYFLVFEYVFKYVDLPCCAASAYFS